MNADEVIAPMAGGVYLIHFDAPYEHARHYLGYARNIEARVGHHRNGSGANLLRVVRDAGITWRLVRVWPGADRTFERRVKAKASTRCCPICNPATAHSRYAMKEER